MREIFGRKSPHFLCAIRPSSNFVGSICNFVVEKFKNAGLFSRFRLRFLVDMGQNYPLSRFLWPKRPRFCDFRAVGELLFSRPLVASWCASGFLRLGGCVILCICCGYFTIFLVLRLFLFIVSACRCTFCGCGFCSSENCRIFAAELRNTLP